MLNFRDSGHGYPVLLIHGLFGNLDNLANCGRQLQQSGYRVIQFDVVNHGESPTQEQTNYQSMAKDVIELLDHLQIQQCAVIGHSMGGKIAMMLALIAPARITALVVADIAPVRYNSHHVQVFAGLEALWNSPPENRKAADVQLANYIEDSGVRQFLLKNLSWTQGHLRWRLRYSQVKTNYSEILNWPSVTATYSGPVLFIKGALSDYIVSAHQAEIARYFPNAKAHVIAGTGHWLHAEKPEAFNRSVERFLSRTISLSA